MNIQEIKQQLEISTDPHEIDFLYDRLFDIKLEAEAQAQEAFPGQPQRRS